MKNIEYPLLTSEEVCYLLRISPRTLQNYRSDNVIPFHRLSKKKIVYRAEEIAGFVRNRSGLTSYHRDKLEKLLQKYGY